jgi:hypothetical protein
MWNTSYSGEFDELQSWPVISPLHQFTSFENWNELRRENLRAAIIREEMPLLRSAAVTCEHVLEEGIAFWEDGGPERL